MTTKSEQIEKVFFWALLGALFIGFFSLLAPFYSALLFSLVLALTFYPFYQGCLKLFRGQRYIAAFICLVLAFLFVAIPLGVVVSLITNQLLKLAQTFQFDPMSLKALIGEGALAQMVEQWRQTLGIEIDLGEWLKEVLQNSAHYLYQYSPKVAARTANFFLTGLITFVLTYFLFVEGNNLYHEVLDISPLKERHEKMLANEIRVTLRACIYGYLLTGLVQGILASIGFAIVGIKIALLLGVATFILSFIPFLGAASVWLPVVIVFLAKGEYWLAGFMAVYGTLFISGIDNVLKPLLIKGQTKIHPMLLFLAIFGGLKLWGPIGILAGPVLVAVFLATLNIYRQDFR